VREVGRFRIVVQGDRPLSFQETTLRDPPRLVLDLPGVFVPVKQELVVGGPVEVVRAAQFQVCPEITRVVIQWRTPVPYRISTEEGGRQVVVMIEEAKPSALLRSGHVVAIDPGHGGTDPGAIGVTGLVEKDVVLDVSLRLRAFLERQGVRVVMTRETDVFVDLGARVPIALREGATVFVSIHANASVRSVIRGVETGPPGPGDPHRELQGAPGQPHSRGPRGDRLPHQPDGRSSPAHSGLQGHRRSGYRPRHPAVPPLFAPSRTVTGAGAPGTVRVACG
jgi:hypothetical protein